MSQYLPVAAWSTLASNVTLGASAYRYYITVNPLDPNEPGAATSLVAVNDWFIDFAGYPFLIENVAGSVLTVYDILERGDGVISAYAPYADKLGYVYRPLNGAIILTQAQLRKLDSSAADIIQPIEKGVIYSQLLQLDQTNPQTLYGGIPIFSAGLYTDFIDFNLTTTSVQQEGRLNWNAEDGVPQVGLPGGNVYLQIGQEHVIRVYNEDVVPITNGKVVYASSATGNIKKVKLANNTSYDESSRVVGVATEDIPSGHFGYITVTGLVHDMDTDGASMGGQLAYLGTNGNITSTPPTAPNTKVVIGIVVRPHVTEGILYVRIKVIPRLQDLSDVTGSLTTSGQFPSWDHSNSRFNFDKNINDYVPIETLEDSGNPTGFVDNDAITVTYSYTNRTITLTGDLSYYWKGTKKTLTSPWTSSAHTATLGSWFLYSIDGTNFTWSQTRWSFYDVQVSYVNYGASAATTFATREVHGLMDVESHIESHDNIGTYRVSGGNATAGTYALNTDTNAAITPGFDSAVIKDEDISTTIPAWIQGTYSTMYVNSTTSSSTFNLTESFPFLFTPASYITYNNVTAGTLVTGAVNRWFNVYQILIPTTTDTDSQKYRTIFLQPQIEHTSLLSATGEDVRALNLGALPNLSPEFVFWARLTYYTGASYTTTGKVQLVSITYVTGNKANQITVSGFNPTNHAALSNLQWTTSGHIGNAGSVPVFNSLGNAVEASLTNSYIPYKSTNGLSDSPITTDGTGTTIRNKLYLGTIIAPAVDTGVLNSLVYDPSTGEVRQRNILSSQWVTSGSDIYYNGDNVGIGTTAPYGKLHIKDNKTTENSQIILQDVGNWGNQQLHNIQWNDSAGKVGAMGLKYSGADGTVDFQIHSLYNNGYVNSSDVKFTVKGNGNVGIGTSFPILKFTVKGNQSKVGSFENLFMLESNDVSNQLRLKFGLNNSATATSRGAVIQSVEEGVDYRNLLLNPDDGNVGIGRTPTTHKLEVEGSEQITAKLYLGTSTAPTTDTGTLNALVWDNTTGEVKQRAITGGGGTPGGSDTYVQFNDGGVFGGESSFRFSKSVGALTITPTNYINYGLYIHTSNSPLVLKGQSTNYFRYAISSSAFRIDGDGSDGFGTYKSIIVGDYNGGCDLYFNGSKKAETETYGLLITGYGKAEGFVKAYQTLSSATTVTMNVRNGQNARITLGHNVTLTLSNLTDGDEGNIVVTQDSTGGRTLTISPTPKVINSGGGTITLTGTANSIDMLSYTYTNSVLYITYGTNYT